MSSYTGTPNAAAWTSYASKYKFVFIKATEGTYYTSPNFSSQYSGATTAGILRGSYHFANPRDTNGLLQADYFIAHGGGWTADGKTLPGVLDIEYDPYTSNMCYGLTQAQMIAWITAFNNEYVAKEGVYPIIYSTVGWWSTCTGNSSAFSKSNTFWLASINGSSTSGPSSLPAGVGGWAFWQYGQQASIDLNQFNGPLASLQEYATAFPVGSHFPAGAAAGLGQPIGPEVAVTAFGATGYYQSFPNGRGLITSPYGTFTSSGAIFSSWTPQSWGWPTGNMTALTAQTIDGYQQNFSEGASGVSRAYWTPNYGAAWLGGTVLTRYDTLGGPTSAWGWPTASQKTQTAFGVTGSYLSLQGGRAIITSKYGTFTSNGADKGKIYASWSPTRYGWPTTPLTAVTAHGTPGYQQRFSEGSATTARAFLSSANPGVIWVNGSILNRYDALGGTPSMGWPLVPMTSQTAFKLKGYIQRFQSGRALISSTYGVYASNGGIYAAWKPTVRGWATADLKTTTYRGRSGWIQTFRRGSTGPDFGFAPRPSGAVVWVNGTP